MAWRLVLEARCRPTPANGHAVYTPSLTGMGDRAHLLSPEITIDTFVEDLARIILTEELTEVVLVGHSVGGVPISRVADRLPECMAHLAASRSLRLSARRTARCGSTTRKVTTRFLLKGMQLRHPFLWMETASII